MTTCAACGAENRDEARFCDACGAPLTVAEPAREERKVVTVLFADLVGFTQRAETMDPEDVRALLQPYWQRLRAELERFGGTVEKFIGDAVMALFGAPVAHEDDPERAVRAALAIRDWVREENEIQVRIAVNTGEALVLLGARPEEGEGMATGDVVNTAARLQSAAPTNGILVGESTWRATRDRIEFLEVAPVEAKGKAVPIPVWEVVQSRARLGMDLEQQTLTPLVGRDRELSVLVDALDRAKREREPQLVTLVGVPGIGKSRLVAELFAQLEADPELVWWRQGRALPYGAGVSFWALGEMIKAQAGIHENDTEETAAGKLRATVHQTVDEHEQAWVLRHLEPLIGLGEEPGVDRAEAFTSWRRYLEGLAEEHPLVLVFEDLHWADDGLLDFVDHLAEWATGAPILVLGSARPELLDRRPGWGGGKLNSTTLALSPLADAEAARVISGVLEQAVLPAELQSALLERAGGNPLYAEQFARLVLERGSAADLSLPENVQGIIAARLDALPADEKRLLQDAAVLGKVFWSGGVAALANSNTESAAAGLHALERKGFVRRERRSAVAGESEYAFRHVLVREVAYGQVPRPARAEKHTAAAGWMESLGREDDHAELLAHHYVTALDLTRMSGLDSSELTERARLALRRAGDRAAALNSFTVAADFYRSALELWPKDAPDRALVRFALGRVDFLGGNTDPQPLGVVASALLESDLPEFAAEAEALAAEAAWHRGDRAQVDERLARAHALVGPLPPSRQKAWILSQIARYAMLGGQNPEAIDHARAALAMASDLDLTDVRIHALNNLGSARMRLGDLDGMRDLEAGAALGEEMNSPELARMLNNMASAYYGYGDVLKCLELEHQALEVGEKFGLEPLVRFTRANILGSAYRSGDWNKAFTDAARLIEQGELTGQAEAGVREIRAWIRTARGELDEAKEDARRALEIARSVGDPQSLYPALSTFAYVHASAGEHDLARPVAREVLDRLEDPSRQSPFSAPGEMIVTHIDLFGIQSVSRILHLEHHVWTRWLEAARALAGTDYARALAMYEEIGAAPDAALVQLRAASSLVAAGRRHEADVYLRGALRFYRAVDATARIREAETLLAAAG